MPGEKEDAEHTGGRGDEGKKAGHDSSSDEESSSKWLWKFAVGMTRTSSEGWPRVLFTFAVDEEESEQRRAEIMDDLNHVEKQFAELKEQWVFQPVLFIFQTLADRK